MGSTRRASNVEQSNREMDNLASKVAVFSQIALNRTEKPWTAEAVILRPTPNGYGIYHQIT